MSALDSDVGAKNRSCPEVDGESAAGRAEELPAKCVCRLLAAVGEWGGGPMEME